MLSEPAIVVKSKYGNLNQNKPEPDNQIPNKIIIDLEKFETYVRDQLREMYSERLRNNLPLKVKHLTTHCNTFRFFCENMFYIPN